MHFPADGRVLTLRIDAVGPERATARADAAARVVVHANVVERAVVAIELAAAVEVRSVELEHVLRIAASEEWIEEPAVEIAIHPRGRLDVRSRVARRIAGRQIERDPDSGIAVRGANGVAGGAVREEKVVAHPDRGLEVADARRVHA